MGAVLFRKKIEHRTVFQFSKTKRNQVFGFSVSYFQAEPVSTKLHQCEPSYIPNSNIMNWTSLPIWIKLFLVLNLFLNYEHRRSEDCYVFLLQRYEICGLVDLNLLCSLASISTTTFYHETTKTDNA